MSTPESPLAPGAELLHFRLVSRLGDSNSSVWKAEDSRTGKNVAVKVLARRLPSDKAKADALVADVRNAAAMQHPNLVAVQDVIQAGELLLMVMELVEGQAISKVLKRGLPNREQFFRVAMQLSGVLESLHGRGVIHGNLNGDTVILLPSGQVKVAGFNLSNLAPKSSVSMYDAKATEARAVAYMSPEQVTRRPVDLRTDFYSCGVVFYEMSTGKLPFAGATAAELAASIPSDQPANPKAYNAAIDPAQLTLVGRCLFKDPFRRPQTAKQLADEVVKAEPSVVQWMAEMTRVRPVQGGLAPLEPVPAAAAPPAGAATRRSILFLAELSTGDPHADPTRAASRMQQLLGEAVYLFDGQVIDPFGPRLIAEIPNAANAAEVARKAEFDLSELARERPADALRVTMLLHSGEVALAEGKISGAAVDEAVALMERLPPGKVLLTEAFRKQAQLAATPVHPFGEVGGVTLYEIPAPEVELGDLSSDYTAEESQAEAVAPQPSMPTAKRKRKSSRPLAIAAVLLLLVILAAGYFGMKRRDALAAANAKHPEVAAVPTAANPKHVALQTFAVEGTDAVEGVVLAERAETIRLVAQEMLRMYPELRIDDKPSAESTLFTAKLKAVAVPVPAPPAPVTDTTATPATAAGSVPATTATAAASAPPVIQLTPLTAAGAAGRTTTLSDTASGVAALVAFIAAQVRLPERIEPPSAAMEPFAVAVATFAKQGAGPQMDAPLRAAMAADPHFLPAQLFAMRVFHAAGNERDAADAASHVLAMQPSRTEALEALARWNQSTGDIGTALGYWKLVLQNVPNDAEALNTLGRYAFAANDKTRFDAIIKRLASLPPSKAIVHSPDILIANGRVEAAINQYYDVEVKDPSNAALSLKIGRIAVLRHSLPIADIELEKLGRLDPDYGLHILKAYLAAQRGAKAEAEAELKTAKAASKPSDDYYSDAAEVYAFLADERQVVANLEIAANRKEPTMSWLLANPLFNYLQSDPAFQRVAAKLQATRDEIRTAMAQMQL